MTTIADVAGIDRRSAARLRKAGIKTSRAFLEKARDREGLRTLSEKTGIDHETLLDIADTASMMGLEGLGSRYCALLRAAEIHSREDLGRRSAKEVLEALESANHRTRMVRRLPGIQEVGSWVRQAAASDGGGGPAGGST